MKFETLSLNRDFIEVKIPESKTSSLDEVIKCLSNAQAINDVATQCAKVFYFKYYDKSRIFDFKMSSWPLMAFNSLKRAYSAYENGEKIENKFKKRKRFLTSFDKKFFKDNEKNIEVIFKDRSNEIFFNSTKDIANKIKFNVSWESYRDIYLINDVVGEVYLSCLRMLDKKLDHVFSNDPFMYEWHSNIVYTFNENGLRDYTEVFLQLFKKKIAQKMASLDDTNMLDLFDSGISVYASVIAEELTMPPIMGLSKSSNVSITLRSAALTENIYEICDFFNANPKLTRGFLGYSTGIWADKNKLPKLPSKPKSSYSLQHQNLFDILISINSTSSPAIVSSVKLSDLYKVSNKNSKVSFEESFCCFVSNKTGRVSSSVKEIFLNDDRSSIPLDDMVLIDQESFIQSKLF